MVNEHSNLVSTLEGILPTHYEMVLTSKTKTPCISYMELTNVDAETGDTLGYSRIQYQIKVWSNKVKDLQEYALKIDKTLRPLGWRRVGSQELHDPNSTMLQKILTYEALASENY
jgi:hypothetical protein